MKFTSSIKLINIGKLSKIDFEWTEVKDNLHFHI